MDNLIGLIGLLLRLDLRLGLLLVVLLVVGLPYPVAVGLLTGPFGRPTTLMRGEVLVIFGSGEVVVVGCVVVTIVRCIIVIVKCVVVVALVLALE